MTATQTVTDAADVILGLPRGASFRLRGRQYSTGAPGCCSSFGPTCRGGERTQIPVWNEAGRPVLLTVRPSTRGVEILESSRYDL